MLHFIKRCMDVILLRCGYVRMSSQDSHEVDGNACSCDISDERPSQIVKRRIGHTSVLDDSIPALPTASSEDMHIAYFLVFRPQEDGSVQPRVHWDYVSLSGFTSDDIDTMAWKMNADRMLVLRPTEIVYVAPSQTCIQGKEYPDIPAIMSKISSAEELDNFLCSKNTYPCR